VLAFLLALALAWPTASAETPHRQTSHILRTGAASPETSLRKTLMDRLMDKFHTMNDARQGFFQDDISTMVAPYFPPGQSFAETQKVIKEQNLGQLQKFEGQPDPNGDTMYVTKFNLMSGMFSQVYVVLNFDFDGTTETNMTVQKTTAYIRGGNM
jgi:hypothetical protein